jgi:hypothetical protein
MIEGDHPDGYNWWSETVLMMDFASQHSFVIAANFHGGAEVVNYPWDCQSTRHADNDWWIAVSREYADNCQAAGGSSYMSDLNNGITNGYDWYSIYGGRIDYMNHWHGCREVCIEVSTNKNPSSGLDFYWNANRQALLDYLKQALSGIRGTVTDEFGLPLPARVEVLGVDNQDTPHVSTDPDDGDYHRMLLPGTYDLRFSSDGYVPQDITGIVVNAGDATRVDVVMSGTSRIDIHGQVFSLSNDLPVPNATVELVGTGIPQAVTSRSGYYSFRRATEGVYTFRVSAPGYETVEEEHNTTVTNSRVDFGIFRIMESHPCDFEQDECGLTAWGSPLPGWQWGSQSSNPEAHSGSMMWGTVLGSNYADQASWNLELLDIWLLKNDPVLSFWHWYDIESGYDGGNLKISTNGGQSYTVIHPQGGYPESSVTALGEPGYSGFTGQWREAVFDLSAYAGKDVSLRWEFGSDGSQTGRGWYIDDLRIFARVPNPDP